MVGFFRNTHDSWVKERAAELLNAQLNIEEEIDLLNRIQARAQAEGIPIPPDVESAFHQEQHFNDVASQRSETMVRNILAILREHPADMIALIIGEAHSQKVSTLLRSASVSFALIAPASLVDDSTAADLTPEAFNRKLDKKSVDDSGFLGNILSSPRKPAPVLSETWLQNKTEIYYLSVEAARITAAGGSGPPPEHPEGGHAHPDIHHDDCIERHNRAVLFCLDTMDMVLWGKVLQTDVRPTISVEKELSAARDRLKASNNEGRIIGLAPGLVAIFSTDENTVRNTDLNSGAE